MDEVQGRASQALFAGVPVPFARLTDFHWNKKTIVTSIFVAMRVTKMASGRVENGPGRSVSDGERTALVCDCM